MMPSSASSGVRDAPAPVVPGCERMSVRVTSPSNVAGAPYALNGAPETFISGGVSGGPAAPAAAIVSRVTVQSREDVLGGRPFGAVGGYEKLVGVVEFALDPANAANAAIVDLAHAQKDASGRVIASANFMVLRPKTMPRERAVALLEVG